MGKRGAFGSFGASLSLIAAGLITFVLLTSLVAYRGWPGMRAAAVQRTISLPATPPADERGAVAPSVVRVPARTHQAAHPSHGAKHPHAAVRSHAPARSAAPDRSGVAGETAEGKGDVKPLAAKPAPSATSAPATTPAATPAVPVPSPVQQVVDGVAKTVDDGVHSVGEVADSLLDQTP